MDDAISMKVFTYKSNIEENLVAKWKLPCEDGWNAGKEWSNGELQRMKVNLNNVKSELNDKRLDRWTKHTRFMNVGVDIVPAVRKIIQSPNLCTIAWCKLQEILHSFPVVPEVTLDSRNFNTLHLCEAPGAFIKSLEYYFDHFRGRDLLTRWRWLGITYNPYYEGISSNLMIADDGFIRETLDNWLFGQSDTGDILDIMNLEDMINQINHKINPVSFITADGSVNCQRDPGEQESIISQLVAAEIFIALSVLKLGGNFVLKLFTLFEATSMCFMYLINCLFEKVSICKPISSKPGNSEVYIVALNYKYPRDFLKFVPHFMKSLRLLDYTNKPLFTENSIPTSFINQHVMCSQFFTNLQISVIRKNIDYFGDIDATKRLELDELKGKCKDQYLQLCQLEHSDPRQRQKRLRLGSMSNVMQWKNYRPNIFNVSWKPETFEDSVKWEAMTNMERSVYLASCATNLKRENRSWCKKFPCNYPGTPVANCKFGKPVTRILNSSFCDFDLLDFYNVVCDNFNNPLPETRIDEQVFSAEVEKCLRYEQLITDSDCVSFVTASCVVGEKLEFSLQIDNKLKQSDPPIKVACVFNSCNCIIKPSLHLGQSNEAISQFIRSIHQVCNSSSHSSFIIPVYGVFTRLYAGLLLQLTGLFDQVFVLQMKSVKLCCWLLLWQQRGNTSIQTALQNVLSKVDVQSKLKLNDSPYLECLQILPITHLLTDDVKDYLNTVNNHILLSNLNNIIWNN